MSMCLIGLSYPRSCWSWKHGHSNDCIHSHPCGQGIRQQLKVKTFQADFWGCPSFLSPYLHSKIGTWVFRTLTIQGLFFFFQALDNTNGNFRHYLETAMLLAVCFRDGKYSSFLKNALQSLFPALRSFILRHVLELTHFHSWPIFVTIAHWLKCWYSPNCLNIKNDQIW